MHELAGSTKYPKNLASERKNRHQEVGSKTLVKTNGSNNITIQREKVASASARMSLTERHNTTTFDRSK